MAQSYLTPKGTTRLCHTGTQGKEPSKNQSKDSTEPSFYLFTMAEWRHIVEPTLQSIPQKALYPGGYSLLHHLFRLD
ncbi:hypothetical protein IKQ19_06860 [Candidatus Saccharibacteria bacterium]|nr:hypothetical protein [Candidatus Saccharibacteria bacterium]